MGVTGKSRGDEVVTEVTLSFEVKIRCRGDVGVVHVHEFLAQLQQQIQEKGKNAPARVIVDVTPALLVLPKMRRTK